MAATTHISLEKFHARFGDESGYEYWFGEVVRKSAPTWLHAILQSLLTESFYQHGYFAGSELDLRISRAFQPRLDVAASLELESTGYPTKPTDIVAEILSPDDAAGKVFEKCQHYGELGISQIYVFDPIGRSAAQWNPKQTKAGADQRIDPDEWLDSSGRQHLSPLRSTAKAS